MSEPARPARCSLLRVALCVLVWVVALGDSLWIAAETAVGPVVIRLSESHGVHAGDLAAIGLASLSALVVTIIVLAPCWRRAGTEDSHRATDDAADGADGADGADARRP